MVQLVSDKVHCLLSRKSRYVTVRPGDIAKHTAQGPWGFEEPGTFLLFHAMNGDSVDNIKGVPGIGPKTACEMLKFLGNPKTYKEFKNAVRTADTTKIGGRARSALDRMKTQAVWKIFELNYKLVSLKEVLRDDQIDKMISVCYLERDERPDPDPEKFFSMCTEYEMFSIESKRATIHDLVAALR